MRGFLIGAFLFVASASAAQAPRYSMPYSVPFVCDGNERIIECHMSGGYNMKSRAPAGRYFHAIDAVTWLGRR